MLWKKKSIFNKIFKKKQLLDNEREEKKQIFDNEREEKIAELRALFWLSFRVYDEDEVSNDNEILDLNFGETASFNEANEEEVMGYYNKFAALDALDVFYNLALDYCKDALAVLKKRSVKLSHWAEDILKEKPAKNPKKLIKTSYLKKLMKMQNERIKGNKRSQDEMEAQIVAIKRKIADLKQNQCQQKKSKVTINPQQRININVTIVNGNANTIPDIDITISDNEK